MNNLYEKENDILNSPYEVFVFDTRYYDKPVLSHWHYFIELLYFVKGSAYIVSDDQEYILNEGDFIIFHPESLHSIVRKGDQDLLFYGTKFDLNKLHTNSNYLDSISSVFRMAKKDGTPRILFHTNDFVCSDVKRIFEQCIDEINNKEYGYDIEFQALMTQLLSEVIRIWRHEGFKFESSTKKTPNFEHLDNVLEYIDNHSSEQISVNQLASMYNMSYSYFAKCFKIQFGRSCTNYIEFVRISKVKDLLLFTDYDLAYISTETGFCDCSHLIRVFKRSTGLTPKQYRLKYSN